MVKFLSAQVTPPESFTSNSPPTPPPTSEKASPIVSRITTAIKARGQSDLIEPWVSYPLNENQYEELLLEIQNDPTILGDLKEGLRYESRHGGDSNLS